MKLIKSIKNTVILVATCACLTASAGVQNSSLNGGTNNIANAVTNTYGNGPAFGAMNSDWVTLCIKFSLVSTPANPSNVIFNLNNTIGNGVWQTNVLRIPVLANTQGTNFVVLNTNIANPASASGGLFQWSVSSVENANTVAVTNLQVDAVVKPGF